MNLVLVVAYVAFRFGLSSPRLGAAMVFEIFRERSVTPLRRWHWRLISGSEAIAYGRGYRSRREAERAIALVRDACSAEARVVPVTE
jgi:uncharacterized protein YegP (UPF0339 family)